MELNIFHVIFLRVTNLLIKREKTNKIMKAKKKRRKKKTRSAKSSEQVKHESDSKLE